ncbi:MAG: Holliday junction branch migration protein RuvA [Propionibacteriaceae bacterium]|jgi:Holliday junction DNA helicase RuvA|nr:Holliday junction branch migration protein RuvA [Propionibacteriaceae bacterium]
MIASVCGLVCDIAPTAVVIEVGGVGLKILCAPGTAAALRLGETARLETHLAVRDDAFVLYGFLTAADREAFILVQTAAGVGPKLALAILSVLDAAELGRALAQEDLIALSRVPGVGKKVAQRLVLELKDKASRLAAAGAGDEAATPAPDSWREQVAAGLVGLGYSARDAERAVIAVADLNAADPPPPVAEVMRAALKHLAK